MRTEDTVAENIENKDIGINDIGTNNIVAENIEYTRASISVYSEYQFNHDNISKLEIDEDYLITTNSKRDSIEEDNCNVVCYKQDNEVLVSQRKRRKKHKRYKKPHNPFH